MKFIFFLECVPKLTKIALLGSESHYKMAPLERIEYLNKLNLNKIEPKNAAVMMLVYPKKGQVHLVLILRSSYNGAHSSQVAFPGGKFENEDVSFEKTALRETHEEIGVHPKKVEIIKPFTKLYVPPSNFMVYPFLGLCKDEIAFNLDKNEVSEIIEMPLIELLNDDLVVKTNLTTSYNANIEVPAFKIKNHIVWGATAMMLNELKEVLNKIV